jgi:hypothetical protein
LGGISLKICFGVIAIIVLIILFAFILPISQSKETESLLYQCNIQIEGNGNYELIIPSLIYTNGTRISEQLSIKLTKGFVKISQVKTKYGFGFLINGTANASFKIGYGNVRHNVEFDRELTRDLDLFYSKPEKEFRKDFRNDTSKIWFYGNYSEDIKNIKFSLQFYHYKKYYEPRAFMDKRNSYSPDHDASESFSYYAKAEIVSGWNIHNITSQPIYWE